MPVINAAGKTLFKLTVDDRLCRRCRRCFAGDICKGKAFRVLERGEAPFIDMSRCWGCLLCLPACPFEALVKDDYSGASDSAALSS